MEKLKNDILENPYNYAAIYGRKSGSSPNNSEGFQVERCTERLYRENLILYKCYFEKISATKNFTYKRNQFGKLLEAAKAGCFKTIIIYSLDRLIRNSDDWVETKRVLNKYSIRLIICDRAGDFDINSVEGQIIISMLVSNATNEPKKIKERTSNGKRVQRENGIYNSGESVPFGYERKRLKAVFGDKYITKYEEITIEIFIVIYIFKFSKEYIYINNTFSAKEVYKALISILDLVIKNFNIECLEKLANENQNEYNREFVNSVILQIREVSSLGKIKKKIEEYLEFFKIKSRKNSSTYIINILKKTMYAGIMLINAQTAIEDIIIESNSENKSDYIIDKSKFVKITNLEGCIDFETFQYVYCYLMKEKLNRIDNTPDFLFKNKLRCSCGKKLYLKTEGFLQCDNLKCNPYYKNDILKLSLSPIIDNILNDSEYGFSLFKKQVSMSLDNVNKKVLLLRNKKEQCTVEYLKSNNDEYAECIVEVSEKIFKLTYDIELYREKLNYISKLNQVVSEYKLKGNYEYNDIKEIVIDYILVNENIFKDILNETVKEVKIVINAKCNTIHTSIAYSN